MSIPKEPPSVLTYAWIFSQPPATVIARLREHPELWDAVCGQVEAVTIEACAMVAQEWADHYPTSVFPEDGTSIDCQSASAMRHAAEVIALAIRRDTNGKIDALVEDEREACAVMVEGIAELVAVSGDGLAYNEYGYIAAKIRARGGE